MSSAKLPDPMIASAMNAEPRVSVGPVPDWVEDCDPLLDFAVRAGDHVTSLLYSRQIHAELRQSYYHSATRLESMQAVQSESQWRVQFEPGTQSVTLHSIRIRRGDKSIEQADLSRIRILQREDGLDGYVVNGWLTLLLVLEDVRPKDVLEASYTIHGGGRILTDGCMAFFALPESVSVARYRFRVCSAPERALSWKASDDHLRLVESSREGLRIWCWDGTDHIGRKPEMDVPVWHVTSPWIQVSDSPDWGYVARAVDSAWQAQANLSGIATAVAEIVDGESELYKKVERVVRAVQDEHRYLSVNLEFGGQIPTHPTTVLKRRFGDCKDLSFLMVQLLNALEVPARPVLVNSRLRKGVADMLPTPSLFDHVIVEFELDGKTRWIDSTISQQGGGPLGRWTAPFGWGLPVDSKASGLCPAPPLSEDLHKIEVAETLLLDTTGKDCLLAVVETHHGFYADQLRRKCAEQNREDAEEARRLYCMRRFGQASREGEALYRDERDAGVFRTAEVFRLNKCLYPDGSPDRCIFPIPPPWAAWALALTSLKEGETRRAPLAVAHPLRIIHSLEIESSSLPPLPSPRSDVISEFFRYNQRVRGLQRSWTISSEFTTLTDAIPAAKIAQHLKQRDEVWSKSAWQLFLPVGVPRMISHNSFGKLPVPAPESAPSSFTPTASKAADLASREPHRRLEPNFIRLGGGGPGEKSRRRRTRQLKFRSNTAFIVVACLAVICLFWIVISYLHL